MIQQRATSMLGATLMVVLAVTGAHAKLVSYSFTATWMPYGGTTLTLFGVPGIPANAPASGSFTYDTTTVGVGSGPTLYHQSIEAGFTLDIGDKLHLAATDFDVSISNDFHATAPSNATVDIFKVVFDTISAPATPLMVNDAPWTGTTRNFINLQLRFPGDTVQDTSLPSKPPNGFFTDFAYSIVGDSSFNNAPFMVTSILPVVAGDFDGDGTVGAADYNEWRREFGCSGQACGLADGNHDGTVDAADYVIWRDAEASMNVPAQRVAVPEPSALVLTCLASLAWVGVSRWKHKRSHGQ